MSALGQKQTCAAHKLMSALPPKATSNASFSMSALGQKWTSAGYSITSSVVASSDGDTFRPSAFAALRLITSSNLVGCNTGKEAGDAAPPPLALRTQPNHEKLKLARLG